MLAYWIVLFCGIFRVFMVWSGLVLMLLHPNRKIQWHASMLIAYPEPFLLAAVLYWVMPAAAESSSASSGVLTMLGAAFGISSVGLFLWSFLAYRRVGTGHYVDENHRVVTTGPYSLVRHPFYTSAFLCWTGVALAAANIWVTGLFVLYVIPAYWFYAASEEKMMTATFGAQYEDYRRSVPMFLPSLISSRHKNA